MNEENKNKIGTIENASDIKDIPTAFFKPITEVQTQQTEMLETYHKEKGDIAETNVPDLTEEVRKLEKKLKAKRFSMPISIVLLIVVMINICWFAGVKFLIVPKYENYINEHETIKKDYEYLKKTIDALVGRD